MKRVCALLGLMFAASAGAADYDKAGNNGNSSLARWNDIVGVITASGVDNPVSDRIHSGTFAWTTSGGRARVDFATGQASFEVEGLVINGTMFSGTPGPVTAVVGTLVCNPGDPDKEKTLDTPAVPLDSRGNASFASPIPPVPSPCANPLFLVRIAVPEGAAGRWIATGTDRRLGSLIQSQ